MQSGQIARSSPSLRTSHLPIFFRVLLFLITNFIYLFGNLPLRDLATTWWNGWVLDLEL